MFHFKYLCLSTIVALGLFTSMPQLSAAEFDASQTKAIEKIVRDYLLQNPDILVEVMAELEAKHEAAQKDIQDAAIAKHHKAIYEDPTSFVFGNPKGDVTIVEFFDYNCGFCKRAFEPLMKAIKADGNVRLILKEFPILGPSSVIASRATMAAERQGKYMEMHKALFTHKGSLDEASIMELAKGVGLDTAKLRRDMADTAYTQTIVRNEALAQALDITGTPAFIIDGDMYPGAQTAEQIEAAIKDARILGEIFGD